MKTARTILLFFVINYIQGIMAGYLGYMLGIPMTAMMISSLILGYAIGIVGGWYLALSYLGPVADKDVIFHLPAEPSLQGVLGGEVTKLDEDLAITPLPASALQDAYTPAYLRG